MSRMAGRRPIPCSAIPPSRANRSWRRRPSLRERSRLLRFRPDRHPRYRDPPSDDRTRCATDCATRTTILRAARKFRLRMDCPAVPRRASRDRRRCAAACPAIRTCFARDCRDRSRSRRRPFPRRDSRRDRISARRRCGWRRAARSAAIEAPTRDRRDRNCLH